jgi:hypothetical protein
MPSPQSVILARCLFAPATLMWCTLMLDRQRSRALREWTRTVWPYAWLGGPVWWNLERLASSASRPERCSAAAATSQGAPREAVVRPSAPAVRPDGEGIVGPLRDGSPKRKRATAARAPAAKGKVRRATRQVGAAGKAGGAGPAAAPRRSPGT